MMRLIVLMLALALAGCGKSAEEKAREDERAVAAVNEAQNRLPPIKLLQLETLSAEDLARMSDKGASCTVYSNDRALVVARPRFGWIRFESALVQLVSDSGSTTGPFGTRTHYTGRELSFRIDPAGPAEEGASAGEMTLPAAVSITDQWDRVVGGFAGVMRCQSV